MSPSERVVLPDPSSLDGLSDHCTPAHARRLRLPVLRTISSATGAMVVSMFALIVAAFAYSHGWPAAIVAGAAYSLLVVVLVAHVIQTAVPARRPRLHPRRTTYVLQGGTAAIEARATGPGRGVVELSNHAKLPGTSSDTVRTMRRTLITALLHTNPRTALRVTTRVPALAQLYAEDFDVVAEQLGLGRRSVTQPVRAWERVIGLRTEVLLGPE
ncbi:hypothetical protein ACFT2C_05050 [Promicromonospora sp. NPDC057138]|uniref:hypothetical protein n=1 Tax=Promicromonospora sp. NPDC057138 TaxID=3346031 RepID=UPI003630FA9A